MVDKEWIQERFLYWVKKLWGENVVALKYNFIVKDQNILMSVGYQHKPSPYRIIKQDINVYISKRILSWTNLEDVEKVVKHEAIHVGIANHDWWFRSKCKEIGACMTETNINETDKPFKVYMKVGGRYSKLLREENHLEMARLFVREQAARDREQGIHNKYQIRY